MDIQKTLFDSLFLLPSLRHDAARLNISGLDGWVSPHVSPYANRCRFVSGAGHVDSMKKCIQFFFQRSQGLTWVIGDEEYRDGTYDILKSAGFVENRFSLLDGMAIDLSHFDVSPIDPIDPIDIIGISNEEVAINAAMIARFYGYDSDEVAKFYWTTSIQTTDTSVRVYCLRDKESGYPIGYAKSVFMHKLGVVIMSGVCIAPEERGKGLHRRLTEYRLLDARRHNATTAVVQADTKGSAYLYRNMGFRRICGVRFLEWLAPS